MHFTIFREGVNNQYLQGVLGYMNFTSVIFSTVRPQDTRHQAARTSQMQVFELGPKKFEMNEFM